MSEFLTDLTVREIDDGTWMVVSPLDYKSDLLGVTVEVPALFRTDFASVPRVPFIFDVLGDIAHEPAVIHDWLYYIGIYGRAKSDSVLLEAMKANDVSAFKRWQIYIGVRVGGWLAWNDHRKKGHSLKDFPGSSPK